MHGFLASSLWAILRHNGDDDASVSLLIEDGGWNSSLAAVASSSKGGVNVWTPFAMRACCFLCAVAEFCVLLSSLWFLRFLCLGAKCCNWILPLLMVFYAWTTDIVFPTTVIWFWCSYHTYLQWFWLHIREEPVFLACNAFPVSISEDVMQFCGVCEEM